MAEPLPIFIRFEKEARSFLSCYIETLSSKGIIDSGIHMNYPPKIILSIFAQYMLNEFNEDWLNTVMTLPGQEEKVLFSYFRDTPNEQRVSNFLHTIFASFYKCDLTDKVRSYFHSDTSFTEEEKAICKVFYEKLIGMNRFHLYHSFGLIPSEKEKEEMNQTSIDYNEYITQNARDPDCMRVLNRFDPILKQLASEHRIKEIKF